MLTINQWDEADRPREKLMAKGAQALTDAELLAILIGSGRAGESAVELMKKVMADCGNSLNTLGKRTLEELTAYGGIGPAKAVTIMAACELGKRRQREKVEERRRMASSADIYDFMHTVIQDTEVEEAWVLLLNRNLGLVKAECVSRGGITETAVDVRLVIKQAVMCNATALALSHNHPSGNVRPSRDDDRLTECVRKACELMRISFVDHLIVADGNYYSYRDNDRL